MPRKPKYGPIALKCRSVKASTSGKFDKVKIGSRYYRAKGKVMDVNPKGGTVRVCQTGKTHKMQTASGTLVALRKVPKARRRARR